MRKRAIIAIVALIICLLIFLSGVSFFSYVIGTIFGGGLHFYQDRTGEVHVDSNTGNISGPLWGFVLLVLLPIAFIISIVILLLELRAHAAI